MPLEFNCPNGHRIINCPEDRAGREGRCPKCGVVFRIPNVSGVTATKQPEAASAGVGAAGGSAAGGSSVGGLAGGSAINLSAAQSGNLTQAAAAATIVFLCPNGHRLSAPSRMEGQAGQCPHCGARFLVPVATDVDQVNEVDLTDIGDHDGGALAAANFGVSVGPPPVHSLCKLMRQLWAEKEHGAVVEIHLEGGAMLAPDWFDERLSRQAHGLFAAQSADGTVTMTAIAWDSVTRVVVRNVEGIPDGMFE